MLRGAQHANTRLALGTAPPFTVEHIGHLSKTPSNYAARPTEMRGLETEIQDQWSVHRAPSFDSMVQSPKPISDNSDILFAVALMNRMQYLVLWIRGWLANHSVSPRFQDILQTLGTKTGNLIWHKGLVILQSYSNRANSS